MESRNYVVITLLYPKKEASSWEKFNPENVKNAYLQK